jgi:NTP pyrophosphatase (non-canonical NTP hydrolase)
MNYDIDKNVIAHSIEFYGQDKQLVVCMEECAELQQAISKHIRGKANRDNEIEELADVLICVEMARQIFNIDNKEINAMIKQKQDRLKERTDYEEEKADFTVYRGKRIDNNKWIYGYLDKTNTLLSISYMKNDVIVASNVSFNTLCRFTGLLDMYLKPIYENDILQDNDTKKLFVVHIDEEKPVFREKNKPYLYKTNEFNIDNKKIVGNIFDNKDLLGDNK